MGSKRTTAENHALSVALHYMHYNFCRIHKSLRITPAMAAGVSDHVWDVGNIVDMLESWERREQIKRAMASNGWHT